MRRLFIIIAIAITCGLTAMAQDNPVSNHTCGGGDHNVIGIDRGFVRAGITLTYNAESQSIIANGLKDRINYAVTLQSVTTLEEWTDQISTFSNVINVSFLDAGKYKIILESDEGARYTFVLNLGDNESSVYDGSLFPQQTSGQAGRRLF